MFIYKNLTQILYFLYKNTFYLSMTKIILTGVDGNLGAQAAKYLMKLTKNMKKLILNSLAL